MSEIIEYIIRFLVDEHLSDEVACFNSDELLSEDVSRFVGYASVNSLETGDVTCKNAYSSDRKSLEVYKVVIIKSDFFDEGVYGTTKTIPSLPLKTIEGIPFLYGTPDIECINDTIVVHADLIASAFFLMTRYEEMIFRDKRDQFGRFPGRDSLPFRAGFIDRPVVDEYGKLIRKWLKMIGVTINEPPQKIQKINLTHDVDVPFSCRRWRNVARKILAGGNPIQSISNKFKPLHDDPYYTFPWMLQQDKWLQTKAGENRCQSFLFFKAGGKTKNDKPRYNLYGKDVGILFSLCREQNTRVGLHSSFQAGMKPSLICKEKENLELAYGATIQHNRNHFLSSREPEDMEQLEKVGIKDDYTMGFADVAGFRLGTSLPVRYINCATRHLTSLKLHPLIIMEGTLNDPRYMNLTADEAEKYCKRLIQNVRQVNGELTLLWHNTAVVEGSGYQRDLYRKLINYLADNL